VDELVVQVWRVADVLERIVGIRSKTPEDNIISWPKSRGEEMKTVERINKGKQRKQSSDGVEEKGEVEGQEEKDAIESMKVGSGSLSLVAYSVGTRASVRGHLGWCLVSIEGLFY